MAAPIDNSVRAVALFATTMAHDGAAPLHVAFLDGDLMLIALRYLDWPVGLTLEQHVRDLAQEALCFGAKNIVVGRSKLDHETLEPTDDKCACAPLMKTALATFGITLRDCLILAPDSYLSMADEGVI